MKREDAHRGKDVDGKVCGSGVRQWSVPVVSEVREVADDDSREEVETMKRRLCQEFPGTTVRSDRRLAAVQM
jgi:hypothetical protein